MSERIQHTPDIEKFNNLVESDLRGVNNRIDVWKETAKSSDIDWLLIIHGCDDSRVGTPNDVQLITDRYGNQKRTLITNTKAIGGGATEVLPEVVGYYVNIGVPREKILVVVTQHGTSSEIDAVTKGEDSNVTCGLRSLLRKYEEEFSKIRNATDDQRTGMMTNLADQIGIPVGLIARAVDINYSPDIAENLSAVSAKMQEIMKEQGFGDIEFYSGYYDHNQKQIRIRSGTKDQRDIKIPGVEEWQYTHQDPSSLIISHGIVAASIPDGVLLPGIVGGGANNDFGSTATNARNLRGALYDHYYSVSHIRAQDGDPNFIHTELMSIVCDNQDRTEEAFRLLNDPEIRADFEEHLKKIGGVIVGNISSEKSEIVKF